ncbi:hypothetical protein HOY82DRAFT_616567 [Tuber indicum]|nr:hypothetical protein HOY82DRAFT_616567 [Tuber indicum]
MPATRTEKKEIYKSPVVMSLRRSQRPMTAAQTALRNAIERQPLLNGSTLVNGSTSASATLSSTFSSPSTSEYLFNQGMMRQSPLPVGAGLPKKRKRSPVRKGYPDIQEKPNNIMYMDTPSVRLSRRLQAAQEESEAARMRNKLDEGDSAAPSNSLRTSKKNKGAMVAGKAKKVAKEPEQGNRELRGMSNGVAKNKKVAPKAKRFSYLDKGTSPEPADVDMPDYAATPAGRSFNVSTKDPSPGSGDVSMCDAGTNSPEVNGCGSKMEAPKRMTMMDIARGIGRHFGIFIAAVQDSTGDLRDSGEYNAWREFFGKL